jgi:hypothetical protein
MNTALEYSTRVVQEGGRRCKKSTLNDLVNLTPLRIPLMNPPLHYLAQVARAEKGVVFPPLVYNPLPSYCLGAFNLKTNLIHFHPKLLFMLVNKKNFTGP